MPVWYNLFRDASGTLPKSQLQFLKKNKITVHFMISSSKFDPKFELEMGLWQDPT
jgi:hypothetical protein